MQVGLLDSRPAFNSGRILSMLLVRIVKQHEAFTGLHDVRQMMIWQSKRCLDVILMHIYSPTGFEAT